MNGVSNNFVDDRLLRSEITYLVECRPPYQPPSSFKSFAVEDRPGEQWVRLRATRASAGAGAEEVKVEATMFDGAAEPVPDDTPLFRRVESLERGPRLHLSLIVEVTRGERVLGFICSAGPDDLAVAVRGSVLKVMEPHSLDGLGASADSSFCGGAGTKGHVYRIMSVPLNMPS